MPSWQPSALTSSGTQNTQWRWPLPKELRENLGNTVLFTNSFAAASIKELSYLWVAASIGARLENELQTTSLLYRYSLTNMWKKYQPGKNVFLLWRLKKAFNSIWHAWLKLKWLQCVAGGKARPKCWLQSILQNKHAKTGERDQVISFQVFKHQRKAFWFWGTSKFMIFPEGKRCWLQVTRPVPLSHLSLLGRVAHNLQTLMISTQGFQKWIGRKWSKIIPHLLFKCRLCLFCVYSMSGGGRSVREGLAMRVQGPTFRSPGPMLKSQAW